MMTRKFGPVLLGLLLMLVAAACDGLAGEPEIVATLPPGNASVAQGQQETGTGQMPAEVDRTNGANIWLSNCAACHGEVGQGTDQGPGFDQILRLSDAALFERVSNGTANMPAFSGMLSEQDRWDVISFAQMLGTAIAQREGTFTEPTAVAGAVDPNAELPADHPPLDGESDTASGGQDAVDTDSLNESAVLRVSGKITNGTAEGIVPADLRVTLNVVDADFNNDPHEATVDETGTFVFEDIPRALDTQYLVTTTYQDVMFGSEMVTVNPALTQIDLPVTIYETTDDPSVIEMTTFMQQGSFLEPGVMEFMQIMQFNNTSDRVFVNPGQGESELDQSLEITLPQNAQLLDFGETSQRYITEPGKLIDTRPVLPGSDHMIHILYDVPYSDTLQANLTIDYDFTGTARVFLPEDYPFESEDFVFMGNQPTETLTMNVYGSDAPFTAGTRLSYTIEEPATTSSGSSSSVAGVSTDTLAGILMGAGISSLVMAAFLYWRGQNTPPQQPTETPQASVHPLVKQIAELDVRYKAGELDEAEYHKQREKLKAQLADAMQHKPA